MFNEPAPQRRRRSIWVAAVDRTSANLIWVGPHRDGVIHHEVVAAVDCRPNRNRASDPPFGFLPWTSGIDTTPLQRVSTWLESNLRWRPAAQFHLFGRPNLLARILRRTPDHLRARIVEHPVEGFSARPESALARVEVRALVEALLGRSVVPPVTQGGDAGGARLEGLQA